jgi:hypothetical protein
MLHPTIPDALPGVVWRSRTAFRGRPLARVLELQPYEGDPVHYVLFMPRTVAGKKRPLLKSAKTAEALIDYAKAELLP